MSGFTSEKEGRPLAPTSGYHQRRKQSGKVDMIHFTSYVWSSWPLSQQNNTITHETTRLSFLLGQSSGIQLESDKNSDLHHYSEKLKNTLWMAFTIWTATIGENIESFHRIAWLLKCFSSSLELGSLNSGGSFCQLMFLLAQKMTAQQKSRPKFSIPYWYVEALVRRKKRVHHARKEKTGLQ